VTESVYSNTEDPISSAFPSVATIDTGYKGCHGFVCAAGLKLIVGTFPLPTFSTTELVGARLLLAALCLAHNLFGELTLESLLFRIGKLCGVHLYEGFRGELTGQNTSPQGGVFWVLAIEVESPIFVLVRGGGSANGTEQCNLNGNGGGERIILRSRKGLLFTEQRVGKK